MSVKKRQIQRQIDKIDSWTLYRGFTISKEKTVAMHFIPPYLHPNQQQPDPELYLNDHQIKVVEQTKFLGLIWDSKLNFRAHIDYLKKKCNKAMNILRVIAHYDWGADQATLLHLYRSLIRSKLDYGCMVYGSASNSYIKQLDTIQNEALRICLGAFKSSPINSLHVEANELPLTYRRQKLSLQYGIKVKALPENQAHSYVFPTDYTYGHCLERRAILAFRVRLQTMLDSIDMNIYDIAINEDLLDNPLWDMPEYTTLTHISIYEKDSTLPQFYRDQFHITKDEFVDYEAIYTDGSKWGNKVAYAFNTSLIESSKRIPDGSSIFTAEALAVLHALKYIRQSYLKKFIIFTDSLSLIQSIGNENLKNAIVIKKIQILGQIQNKKVVFCWIPSHVGISGNEKADKTSTK